MSDDEDDQNFFSSQPAEASPAVSHHQTLFFGDEDEDEEDVDEVKVVSQKQVPPKPSALKRSSVNGTDHDDRLKRVRVQSEEVTPALSRQASTISDTSSEGETSNWDKRFIGTFIIPAWSLSKGSNYVQQGDRIKIVRQKPKQAGQQTPVKQGKNGMGGPVGNKQTKLTFGSAGGAMPTKKAKVKEDYVVRFSNMRGKWSPVIFYWTAYAVADFLLFGIVRLRSRSHHYRSVGMDV